MEVYTYPESREEICAALRNFGVSDVNETTPLYELQHKLATTTYAKACAAANASTITCKYEPEIQKAYAEMDAASDDAELLRSKLICLSIYGSHNKDSAIYIVHTGLDRIYRAMLLSAECAYYGCLMLCYLCQHGNYNLSECGGVRIVLDVMSEYKDSNRGRVVLMKGFQLLHAAVMSSPANAVIVALESDAAAIVLAVKHMCGSEAYSQEIVEKCNAVLVLL